MASRSSADKLKPLPPDPDRHQHSAIPPPLRVSFFLDRNPLFFRGDTGDKGDCKGERTFRVGPGEETGGDRLIRGLVYVSPVTPACFLSDEGLPSWSPLSHLSPVRKDGSHRNSSQFVRS